MITLQEALEFTDEKLKRGEVSDGCTYAPDLGITKWCVMHDMLRRFRPISALEADNLFFKGILTKGPRYLPVAIIYWLAVRWAALLGGSPLPAMLLLFLITAFSILAYISTH